MSKTKFETKPEAKPCGLCSTSIENFNVRKGKTDILKAVNFHIHCGQLTALIGPNGAGKTTLLKSILGEVAHSGEIKFVDAAGLRTNHPLIGYVPQHLAFDTNSPLSVLDLFAASRTTRPVWLGHSRSLKQHTLEQLSRVEAEPLLNRRLGALSGGELQRVLLALALDPIPDLLLLDEPVSGVDRPGIQLFYELVSSLRRRYDLSIILVSHNLGLVGRYADQIVLLNQTVLCSGTPDEVFNNEHFKELFTFPIQGSEGSRLQSVTN